MGNSSEMPDIIASSTVQPIKNLRHDDDDHRQLPYFHEYLDKDGAYQYLKKSRPGSFLLRPSSLPNSIAALSLRTSTGVVHVRIYRNDADRYYLDTTELVGDTIRSNRHTYESVEILIERLTKKPGRQAAQEILKLSDFSIPPSSNGGGNGENSSNTQQQDDEKTQAENKDQLFDEVQLTKPILARKRGTIVAPRLDEQRQEARSVSSDNLWDNNPEQRRPTRAVRQLSEDGAKDWLSDVL